MRKKLLNLVFPIGLGLILSVLTLWGLGGCEPIVACDAGELEGNDGSCYHCDAGAYASYSYFAGCSSAIAGVYCCPGSGGGGGGTARCNPGNTYNFSSGKCCPNSTPYYYPGTHGIKPAGCYSSCPYVGDCGTSFQKY